MTSFVQTETKRRRGPNKPRAHGASKAAKRLYDLYYLPEHTAARSAILAAVAACYANVADPLRRAQDLVHKWATGERVNPSYKYRVALAPWIPMKDWDEVAS